VKGTIHIVGQAERELLKGWVNSLSFNGRDTNFDEALKGAQAGLFQAGITKDGTICIFSDGISDPSDSKDVLDLQAAAKQVFPQEEGYSVYLIGVGKDSPGVSGCSQQDNVVTVRISGEDMQKVLDGIRENQNLLELLTADARAATATPEVAQPAEKRLPNLTPGFLRKNWKLLTLALGLAVLCALGYGIWWVFISEDPGTKKASGSQSAEVRRAQFNILDSDQRPYIARITDGNRISIGNCPQCQVRVNVLDRVAAYVVFERNGAYLIREGISQVSINDETVKNRMELNSGGTVRIGEESVKFEVISAGRTGNNIEDLIRAYRR